MPEESRLPNSDRKDSLQSHLPSGLRDWRDDRETRSGPGCEPSRGLCPGKQTPHFLPAAGPGAECLPSSLMVTCSESFSYSASSCGGVGTRPIREGPHCTWRCPGPALPHLPLPASPACCLHPNEPQDVPAVSLLGLPDPHGSHPDPHRVDRRQRPPTSALQGRTRGLETGMLGRATYPARLGAGQGAGRSCRQVALTPPPPTLSPVLAVHALSQSAYRAGRASPHLSSASCTHLVTGPGQRSTPGVPPSAAPASEVIPVIDRSMQRLTVCSGFSPRFRVPQAPLSSRLVLVARIEPKTSRYMLCH